MRWRASRLTHSLNHTGVSGRQVLHRGYRGAKALMRGYRGARLHELPVQSGKLWRHPTGARLGRVLQGMQSFGPGFARAASPCGAVQPPVDGGSKGAVCPLWRGTLRQQRITSPFSLFSPAGNFLPGCLLLSPCPPRQPGVFCVILVFWCSEWGAVSDWLGYGAIQVRSESLQSGKAWPLGHRCRRLSRRNETHG